MTGTRVCRHGNGLNRVGKAFTKCIDIVKMLALDHVANVVSWE